MLWTWCNKIEIKTNFGPIPPLHPFSISFAPSTERGRAFVLISILLRFALFLLRACVPFCAGSHRSVTWNRWRELFFSLGLKFLRESIEYFTRRTVWNIQWRKVSTCAGYFFYWNRKRYEFFLVRREKPLRMTSPTTSSGHKWFTWSEEDDFSGTTSHWEHDGAYQENSSCSRENQAVCNFTQPPHQSVSVAQNLLEQHQQQLQKSN